MVWVWIPATGLSLVGLFSVARPEAVRPEVVRPEVVKPEVVKPLVLLFEVGLFFVVSTLLRVSNPWNWFYLARYRQVPQHFTRERVPDLT